MYRIKFNNMRLSLFLLILLFPLLSIGQKSFISKQNAFYLGVVNPLKILKGNLPCKNLVIKSDHGEVYADNCTFKFYSEIPGPVHFTVYEKTSAGLKKLEEADFKMKWFDKPVFRIAYGMARVPLFEIKRQDTVSVVCQNLEYKIKKFSIQALYNASGTFKTVTNFGGKLSSEAKALFSQLKLEDSFTVYSIIAIDPNGKEVNISSSTFTVY